MYAFTLHVCLRKINLSLYYYINIYEIYIFKKSTIFFLQIIITVFFLRICHFSFLYLVKYISHNVILMLFELKQF